MNEDVIVDTIAEWFTTLNYQYMILHVIVCYGVYYSENMRWIVEHFSPVRKKGRTRAVWLVGGVLALIEMIKFLPHASQHDMYDYQKFISIFHSYIVVQVFVDPIVTKVHKWLRVILDLKKEK